RITNRSGQAMQMRWSAEWPLVHAASLAAFASQSGLTLSVTTDYSSDVMVSTASASTGRTTVRGASIVWDGQLADGQRAEIRSTLQQLPTTAFSVNQPVRGQTLVVSDARGASLIVPPPPPPALPPAQRLVQPPPPPVDPITGSRFFAETGFAISDDAIWL